MLAQVRFLVDHRRICVWPKDWVENQTAMRYN
jgi:hypothetical protein